MKYLFYFILLAGFTFSSCSSSAQKETNIVLEKISVHKVVSASEFAVKLSKEEVPQLLDVRTPNEFATGSIKGAKNVNFLDGTFQNTLSNLDKTKPVFVFCAVGGRSGKAASLLKKEGFQVVFDLKGGYNGWSEK